jgi:hypothetical protein
MAFHAHISTGAWAIGLWWPRFWDISRTHRHNSINQSMRWFRPVRPSCFFFFARSALVTDKILLCPEILLPICLLLSIFVYFGTFLRTRVAKCFTNSSKRFRCAVMLENEQVFWSCIHHVRTCTYFAQLAWAAA